MRFERTYGKTNQNYRTFNNCYLCIANFFSGIERDMTMADDLMHIPNDGTQNYPFCRLQLLVETFGHLTYQTNQSKFNNSTR